MIAYEFYWHNPVKGYELIGILPERRRDSKRITRQSVMNWVRMILGEKSDFNDIFFVQVTIDKNSGEILRLTDREEF